MNTQHTPTLEEIQKIKEYVETHMQPEVAAFIVRAVNAHEELLAALKMAFKFIESRSDTASADWIDSWKAVVDAIAKATGGK